MKHDLTLWLSRIRIVMVETTLPANIGSAARALHTMGLADLVVVNPRLPIDDTSYANAAGASELLGKTRIVPTLDAALSDCSMVFAASARSRQMPRPVVTPMLAAQLMAQHLSAQPEALPTIAVLFGRENHGLSNEELAQAGYHIQIPANPDYPVLNVASAIQVISAYIFAQFSEYLEKMTNADLAGQASSQLGTLADTAAGQDSVHILTTPDIHQYKQTQGHTPKTHPIDITIRGIWDEPAITHAQAQSLNQALVDLMRQLNLAHDDHLKHLPDRLSRLVSRLQLDQKEYALVRALIAKIQKL